MSKKKIPNMEQMENKSKHVEGKAEELKKQELVALKHKALIPDDDGGEYFNQVVQ